MTTRTPPTRASRRPSRPRAPTTIPPSNPDRPKADRGIAPPPQAGRVTLAVVTGAHGIGGEVKLKLFTDDLTAYGKFNDGALTLTSLRGVVARFAEITDRTAAEALRGVALTVARADLPPLDDDEYYHADLIGLEVCTPDGTPAGRIVEVENFGAGDVIEIERADGKRFMVPMRPEAVPEWNADRLILDPAFAGA